MKIIQQKKSKERLGSSKCFGVYGKIEELKLTTKGTLINQVTTIDVSAVR